MEQSSSQTSKYLNTKNCILQNQKMKNPVNWVSVINFLENQYTKSTIRQKEWIVEKKLLQQEIQKLKNQLFATQRLNKNLNNRIKLLQYALRKQKLLKQPNQNPKLEKPLEEIKTIQQVQKYLQKNGWSLSQKPKNPTQSTHRKFLEKILEEVGLNFNKIQSQCKNIPPSSIQSSEIQKSDQVETFQTLINQLNRVRIHKKIKINAHLDSVRGIFPIKNQNSKDFLVSVSEDCLIKLWDISSKQEPIQSVKSLRQHTGQLFTIDGGQINQKKNLVLFTAGTEQFIKVWHLGQGNKNQDLKCMGSFTNKGQQNISQSYELQTDIIWDLKYKKERLLTAASDGVVRMFKIQSSNFDNNFASQIKPHSQFYQKNYIQTVLEWVGISGFLAGCTNSPRIHLWDIQRSKIVQRFIYQIDKPKQDKETSKKENFSNSFQINCLKYDSLTKSIYTGCEDRKIRIFSYDQNKIIKKLDNGVNDSINCLDLYKTNFIVAGCQNGFIKVWDRRTYKLLIDQAGHSTKYDEGILCVKAADNGIFTGGADGVINFYTI